MEAPGEGGEEQPGDHDDIPAPDETQTMRVHLAGAVQKGPFIVGSTVLVSNLDARANPTGAVYSTATHDDLGQFALDFDATSLIAVEGTGYYYNEATGSLSAGPVTLRALHNVRSAGNREVYVNPITHLTFDRIKKLMADGASFEAARGRAERELQLALGIAPPTFSAGTVAARMNILGGDSDANSYLFSVSAVLAYTAQITDWENQAAALQQLLNRLAVDLSRDGQIDAHRLTSIEEARYFLSTEDVEEAFAERLRALESSIVVPNLDRSLDHDGDGLTNATDNCRRMSNAGQEDGDGDGLGDACDDELPRKMLCVYVPAIDASPSCDPEAVFLQCSGMRTDADGIRAASGGSIVYIYENWQQSPDFPIPDCARTPPDVAPANWLVRIMLDESDNVMALTPLRALTGTEFESLPHVEDAPNELSFDDELPARLDFLAQQ